MKRRIVKPELFENFPYQLALSLNRSSGPKLKRERVKQPVKHVHWFDTNKICKICGEKMVVK